MSTLQNFSINGIENRKNIVPDLKGKVVLAVNVASKCGLTPQYAGLQKLYEQLEEQNFVIVGFPCNQFGGQEPGTPDQIVDFCAMHYGVSFPLTEKIEVNGPNKHPIYAWFQTKFPGDIEWNFGKFLVDRHGNVIKRYPPQTPPEDATLLQDISDALEK